MDNIQYAEELVMEFLVFRGFTNTLQAFESELSTDIGKGFQVEKILDLIFSVYVRKFEAEKLVALIRFLRRCFTAPSDTTFLTTLAKLETSVLRFYIIQALQAGRKDKVVEFFEQHGNDLLQKADDWTPWFVIPYLKNASLDPQFRVYFSKEWSDALLLSFRNFLSEMLGVVAAEPDVQREEDFSEVKVKHQVACITKLCSLQESFLGHTSPISRCRFSASGTNIASASSDGTVRIWTYDSSVSTSRNATIYCGAEIMSLEWECKSDRLLLIGTADGGIKAWNVDAKRVVCDFTTTAAFPSVLDMKCSPIDPVFVSAAASKGLGLNNVDKWGHASLTVWNLKTWKSMTVLPLGEDPPAITSVCFNHNGKILAASAVDGMIHMFVDYLFDIFERMLILCLWESNFFLNGDKTCLLGCKLLAGLPMIQLLVLCNLALMRQAYSVLVVMARQIFEWSLHNQGRILWSRDCSRFCNCESTRIPRHEMALDSHGKRLLVTSSSTRSPIYHVQSNLGGLKTLPHSDCITTVDWHPTLPIFLTGSADHSVRVTSIL
ncbi:WD repeat-containing protein 91 [Nymphaea thermarum]|nr:WD repeat-containing protein 91 [Nymphaea thermarum]